MTILKKVKHTIFGTRPATVRSFFDYPASEKAKIIRQAVNESNKMQNELVKKYDRQFAA